MHWDAAINSLIWLHGSKTLAFAASKEKGRPTADWMTAQRTPKEAPDADHDVEQNGPVGLAGIGLKKKRGAGVLVAIPHSALAKGISGINASGIAGTHPLAMHTNTTGDHKYRDGAAVPTGSQGQL